MTERDALLQRAQELEKTIQADYIPKSQYDEQINLKNQEIESAKQARAAQKATLVSVKGPVVSGNHADLMVQAGVPESDRAGVIKIYSQESEICHLRWEGQYGACPTEYVEPYPGAEADKGKGYGICQATPANKMASEGDDWRTNPATQMRWCYKYTLSYGSVQEAINFKYCLGSCYSTRTKSVVFKHTTWF